MKEVYEVKREQVEDLIYNMLWLYGRYNNLKRGYDQTDDFDNQQSLIDRAELLKYVLQFTFELDVLVNYENNDDNGLVTSVEVDGDTYTIVKGGE